MLLLTLVSPVLGANCYLVAPDGGGECVVIDPGFGVEDAVDKALGEHSLRLAGALVTHGHIDHVYGLAELCRRHELPVYVHKADAYRLNDPLSTLGPQLAPMFGDLAGDWTKPADVRPLDGNQTLRLAGLAIEAFHAPGHTEGATLYRIPAADETGAGMCFTGDVLFAGSVGRTDLAGGDDGQMASTLAWLAAPESAGGLPADTAVLPGHGPSSTFGGERAANPYLRQLGA